ncbi:MAG: 50S ribosomal protein L37ae [Methanobacteriota archaeon]|nr:MAG: 50S ribosomal protein L37ae [Euryarchaeota archaeon]
MISTPRYGRKTRKRYGKTEQQTRELYECPTCGKKKLRRRSFAIFVCKSCNSVVAGGAYRANTEAGDTARRAVIAYMQGQLSAEEGS